MNVKFRKNGICIKCNREKIIWAKQMCKSCYNYNGTPVITCEVCGKQKHNHAKGMCFNCYQKLNEKHYNNVKANNYLKWHNISFDLYTSKTRKCLICGFDKVVDLHHLDGDHGNTNPTNLIGLCPNHHKMLHTDKYGKNIENKVKKKLSEIA